MLIRPPSSNEPLFRCLKPVKPGKRTTRKGKEIDIPEGTKRIRTGAYELVYYQVGQTADGSKRRKLKPHEILLESLKKTKAKERFEQVVKPQMNAHCALSEALQVATGRDEINLSNLPDVHLDTGSVFFTPKAYRRLERKAAKEFAAQQASNPALAKKVNEADQHVAELKEQAAQTVSPRLKNIVGTGEAILQSGIEQGRTSNEIKIGIDNAINRIQPTASDISGIVARVKLSLGLDASPEQHALEKTLKAKAAEVLANPNRGKIYIRIEPTPQVGGATPENPFQAVITKIVRPKKKLQ